MKNKKAKLLFKNFKHRNKVSLNSNGELLNIFFFSFLQLKLIDNIKNFRTIQSSKTQSLDTGVGVKAFTERSFDLTAKSNFSDSHIVAVAPVHTIK